jgi:DNA-binding NarL/FixJ family response regulator
LALATVVDPASIMASIAPTLIKILTVDDHPLLREGIAAVLQDEPDMLVVAEANNGREAVERFREYRPDITLMDLQMPEMKGVDAIAAIRTEFPSARIIVLTTYTGDVQAVRAIKAGAFGYLLKGMIRTELLDTIRAVYGGQRCIPPEIASQIATYLADDALTEREVDVLRRVAAGDANKEIAAQLRVSEETVKAHVKSILSKLRANSRTHAVTIGLKRGIIDI